MEKITDNTKRLYINNKADLKEFMEYESKKYKRKNTRMPLFCITEQQFLWKHMVLLRKTEYYLNTKNKIMGTIYKVLLKRYQNMHQIHIPVNSFDKGLRIMHLGPVLVNGKVKGGKNIALHINTAIASGGTDNGAPVLEDGVVLGVGAVVIGGVYLAKNIAVGANALVNKTFKEENISIAGVPAKKISINGRLSWNQQSTKA